MLSSSVINNWLFGCLIFQNHNFSECKKWVQKMNEWSCQANMSRLFTGNHSFPNNFLEGLFTFWRDFNSQTLVSSVPVEGKRVGKAEMG